jgi:tripartite-type tricarboxylate transporter receptor subunit TctC
MKDHIMQSKPLFPLAAMALFIFTALTHLGSFAQDKTTTEYPTTSVRIIVPFAPGGATDVLARLIAVELTGSLKQTFIVENKPGGGGNIGSNQVARSKPDGLTLLMGAAGNIAINPSLFTNMPYNPLTDLAPVALMGSSMNVLVVPASLPVNSVRELIALAKKQPGKLNYSSSGNGGTLHLSGELFDITAGTKIVHVPYQGSGPAMVDLLAGRVDMMFDNLPSSMPHIQNGLLRPLGVTAKKRSASLPNVPTIAESGLSDYEVTTWFGIFAPAGTSIQIVNKLNYAINEALKKPALISRLEGLGAEVATGTAQEFSTLVVADSKKWADVIRKAGIVMN